MLDDDTTMMDCDACESEWGSMDNDSPLSIELFDMFADDVLQRCKVERDINGDSFYVPNVRVQTITAFVNGQGEYASGSFSRYSEVREHGGFPCDMLGTVGMILSANLIAGLFNIETDVESRHDVEKISWKLAWGFGCPISDIYNILEATSEEIYLEKWYVGRYREIAMDPRFGEYERISRMMEVLLRSPVFITPSSFKDLIDEWFMRRPRQPILSDDCFGHMLEIIAYWDRCPIGITALAYSREMVA